MPTLQDLQKTKYYPVDLVNKLIINDPFMTEREMFRKYHVRRPMPVHEKGSHLQEHPLYQQFRIVSAEHEDNRLLQGRYDRAHERAAKVPTEEVVATQSMFEDGDVTIEVFEAVIAAAEHKAA